jgi:hypothetical protein
MVDTYLAHQKMTCKLFIVVAVCRDIIDVVNPLCKGSLDRCNPVCFHTLLSPIFVHLCQSALLQLIFLQDECTDVISGYIIVVRKVTWIKSGNWQIPRG